MTHAAVTRAWSGIGLLGVLATPPLREALEIHLASHVLVQLPLLAAGGAVLASALPPGWHARLASFDERGLAGTLLAVFTLLFWMLPRSLDAALAGVAMGSAKFVTLPLLAGAPLSLSWPQLGPVTKGFVVGNLLSMLGLLGWLYLSAPVRLCNFYLVDEQLVLGKAFFTLAALIASYWTLRLFAGSPVRAARASAGSTGNCT